jgi:hypothetical protein
MMPSLHRLQRLHIASLSQLDLMDGVFMNHPSLTECHFINIIPKLSIVTMTVNVLSMRSLTLHGSPRRLVGSEHVWIIDLLNAKQLQSLSLTGPCRILNDDSVADTLCNLDYNHQRSNVSIVTIGIISIMSTINTGENE